MQVPVSVVIITFNEEKNIARCLSSVKAVADEVVVIDSYSTDQTKEICLAFGARFIEHSFEGHIEQKNFAITQATHPYILSLDADECLTDQAIQDILAIKQNWTHEGYSFRRLNNYCGKWVRHGGWYPDRKLRLWNSKLGSWQGQNPHDEFKLATGSTIKELHSDIEHFTFRAISEHIQQINYFTDISSRALYERGKKSHLGLILLSPIAKFVRDYVIKLGFLDGLEGFIIAKNSAHAKFQKYTKLYFLQNKR